MGPDCPRPAGNHVLHAQLAVGHTSQIQRSVYIGFLSIPSFKWHNSSLCHLFFFPFSFSSSIFIWAPSQRYSKSTRGSLQYEMNNAMNCFTFCRTGLDDSNDGCEEDRGSPVGERGQEEGAQQSVALPGRVPGIRWAATHSSPTVLLQVFIFIYSPNFLKKKKRMRKKKW